MAFLAKLKDVNRTTLFFLLADAAKGALGASIATIVLIMLFAFCIQLFGISDGAIPAVNTVIKGISLLLGAFISMWHRPQQGWLRGLLCGILYTLILYAAFSLADGIWVLNWASLFDLLISAAIGLLCGIITVNIRARFR